MLWTIAAMSGIAWAVVGSPATAATLASSPKVVGYEVASAKAFPATTFVTKCGWALPDVPDNLKAVAATRTRR